MSKGEYAQVQCTRLGLICLILGLCLAIFECAGGAIDSLLKFLLGLQYKPGGLFYKPDFGNVFFAVVCSVLTFCFWKWGKASVKQFHKMDDVVPLTRANTADLPAPDSLVRPSVEPETEQQSVLLRAASEGQDTHGEQLLRAAGGQEQP